MTKKRKVKLVKVLLVEPPFDHIAGAMLIEAKKIETRIHELDHFTQQDFEEEMDGNYDEDDNS